MTPTIAAVPVRVVSMATTVGRVSHMLLTEDELKIVESWFRRMRTESIKIDDVKLNERILQHVRDAKAAKRYTGESRRLRALYEAIRTESIHVGNIDQIDRTYVSIEDLMNMFKELLK